MIIGLLSIALLMVLPAHTDAQKLVSANTNGPMLGANVSEFLQTFAERYPHDMLLSRQMVDTGVSIEQHKVLGLVATALGAKTAADAQASLAAVAIAWQRLASVERAGVTAQLHGAVIHTLGIIILDGQWLDDAIMYTKRILQSVDERWALSLRQQDVAGRWLFAAGRAQNGDSLRYVAELTSEFHRGRGDLYGLLGAALLGQKDTIAAQHAWEQAWTEYGQGEAKGRQYPIARKLLALSRSQGNLTATLRNAGHAILTFPRHDGRVPPELAELESQLDSLYHLTHQDTSKRALRRYLDSLYSHDFPLYAGVRVTPYTGSPKGRSVLLSTMTWVDCGSCRWRDDALDAMLSRYRGYNVYLLVHHYETPFVTPGSWAANTSSGMWTVEQGLTPLPYDRGARDGPCNFIHINGNCYPLYTLTTKTLENRPAPRITVPAPRIYDTVVPWVDSLLAEPEFGAMQVSLHQRADSVGVTVQLDSIKTWPNQLKLQIVLVEDSLHFQGSNYLRIWRMVPRRFAGDSASRFGFVVSESKKGTFRTWFDIGQIERELMLKNEWIDSKKDRFPRNAAELALRTDAYRLGTSRLSVMVFIHDAVTGEVLHTIVKAVPSLFLPE